MPRVTATMTIAREGREIEVVLTGIHYPPVARGYNEDIDEIRAMKDATEYELNDDEIDRAEEILMKSHRDNQQAAIERRGDERRDEE